MESNSLLDALMKAIVDQISTEVVKRLQEGELTKVLQRSLDHDEDFWVRINNHVEKQVNGSSGDPSGRNDFERKVDEQIQNWMDSYLEDKIGDWADSYFSDRIDTWMTDNFDLSDYGDISDKIRDVIRDDLSFDVTVR